MKKIDKLIMQKVLTALAWNEQQYAEFIYGCGLAYLNAFIKGYDIIISQISKSEIFWDWWKDHWENREKEFLEILETFPEDVESVSDLHKTLHDPYDLAAAMNLNGQVLQESYVNLIHDITKNQHQYDTCTI